MRYGNVRWRMLGDTALGAESGREESYRKPAAARARRVAALCSRKGALRGYVRACA